MNLYRLSLVRQARLVPTLSLSFLHAMTLPMSTVLSVQLMRLVHSVG